MAIDAYRARLLSEVGERVRLRDGSEVILRRVRPADKPAFVAAWGHFGAESRHTRFLGFKSRLSLSDLAYLTEIDHVDHEALVVLAPRPGQGQVGVARYIRDPSRPAVAEVAVAIADEWQGRGLAGELLRRLAEHGRDHELQFFTATVLADNTAMLRAFRRLGDVSVQRSDGAVREIDIRLSRPEDSPAPPTTQRATRRA